MSKIVERDGTDRDEYESILRELRSAESKNLEDAKRYVEIEEENNNLANLYVASYRLHSSLDVDEVLKTIVEIVSNLIGAEVFAVYVCDVSSDMLGAVASEGEPLSAFPTLKLGEGLVGRSVLEGEIVLGDPSAPGKSPSNGGEPVVCVPLRVDDRPVGAVAIYKMLQQKDSFSSLDDELFALLAGHAATAIFASRLYSQSQRKLSTIRGFIDLLSR